MSDLITLVMDGKPTLALFATGVRHFHDLVTALTAEQARAGQVEWALDDLQYSSAVITAKGVGPSEMVARTVRRYEEVARDLATDRALEFTGKTRAAVEGLLGVLDTVVPDLVFQTSEEEYIVRPAAEGAEEPATRSGVPISSLGTVEGRVQAMSNRKSLRFTLYDVLWDRAVSCYLTQEQADAMADLWDQYVVVEGTVNRDPLSGRPTSVRDIVSVERTERGDPDAYLRARGAAPAPPGADKPEEVLRRAWE